MLYARGAGAVWRGVGRGVARCGAVWRGVARCGAVWGSGGWGGGWWLLLGGAHAWASGFRVWGARAVCVCPPQHGVSSQLTGPQAGASTGRYRHTPSPGGWMGSVLPFDVCDVRVCASVVAS